MVHKPNHRPGVENEPHLQDRPLHKLPPGDPAEPQGLAFPVPPSTDIDRDVEHSVWDEPSLSTKLAGAPPSDALTYRNWLGQRMSQWTIGQSWFLTLAYAAAAGPAAVAAYLLLLPNLGVLTPVVICLFSPLVQELLKIALPLWAVERRPYYFKYFVQLAICSISAGLFFGIASGSFSYVRFAGELPELFRWISLASYIVVHLVCSSISTLGLYHIWKRPVGKLQPPRLTEGASSFLVAFVIHAGFATTLYVVQLFVVSMQID